MISASTKNDITMLPPPKPMARSTAISRDRSDTAEYMVLRAPKIGAQAHDDRDQHAHAR